MSSEKYLDDKRLNEIKSRCRKARSGPWRSYVEGRDHTSGSSFIKVGEGETRGTDIDFIGVTTDDQDFIAFARQDIPDLLVEIERLRLLLKKYGVDYSSVGSN